MGVGKAGWQRREERYMTRLFLAPVKHVTNTKFVPLPLVRKRL